MSRLLVRSLPSQTMGETTMNELTDANKESILQEAQRLTHGDRNASYGHPLTDYTQTAAIVSALLAAKLREPLTSHEMALVMICVKLSREVRVPKRDNLVDAAGYAWVARECLDKAATMNQCKQQSTRAVWTHARTCPWPRTSCNCGCPKGMAQLADLNSSHPGQYER